MAPMANEEFAILIRRARAGDRSAEDALFARYRERLARLAREQVESWLQAKVDASDLVQQTLLEAHRGLGAFTGENEHEWIAWLRRILAHNAADFVRQYRLAAKRRVGREVPLLPTNHSHPPTPLEPADGDETPSQIAVRRETEEAVAQALAQLSDDHQQVIRLRNLERLPFDDIARVMNRTRPAVQMLWMRALQKLEEQLQAARTEAPPRT